MKELIKKNWSYTLSQDDAKYLLSVLCGTVGLFEVNIYLNEGEIENYIKEGAPYIDRLAQEIRYKPVRFSDRDIS